MQRLGKTFLLVGLWLAVLAGATLYFRHLQNPPARQLAGGVLELAMAADGHFHVDGSIDGQAIRFLIDTGASSVSISTDTARGLGLACQHPTTFRTANGEVQGCLVRVGRLGFGPFSLDNVSVAVLPDLRGEALLGMNVLKSVRLEQDGKYLRLSAR
jgi:clan AA aspartic protease (TIGR02281 family)